MYSDNVGAIVAAKRYIESVAEKTKFVAGEITPAGDVIPSTDPVCQRAVGLLRTLDVGRLVGNLATVGEVYAEGRWIAPDRMLWRSRSIEEIVFSGSKKPPLLRTFERDPGALMWDPELELPPEVVRIWRSSSTWSDQPWSELMSQQALFICEDILLCEMVISASNKSLLAGDIVYIPIEAFAAMRAIMVGPDGQIGDASIMQRFIDHFMDPVSDEFSPEAIMPLLVFGPGDQSGAIQQIQLKSRYDYSELTAMRETRLKDLAMILPVPDTVLLGLGDTNHWNGSIEDDRAVGHYWEPIMQWPADAMAEQWQRPYLTKLYDAGFWTGDPECQTIIPDLSALSKRAKDWQRDNTLAMQGFIAPRVVRREAGYSEDDAPSDDDLRELAKAQQAALGVAPVDPLALPAGPAPVEAPNGGIAPVDNLPATVAAAVTAALAAVLASGFGHRDEGPRTGSRSFIDVTDEDLALMDAALAPPTMASRVADLFQLPPAGREHLEAIEATMRSAAEEDPAVDDPAAELVRLGDQALETGEKVNLADVDPRFEGLGWDRDEMPQLDGDRAAQFLEQLAADGITVEPPAEVDPFTLEATQSELSAAKAREMSLAPNIDELLAEPIIVSSDGFVLDGHHRWVAAMMLGRPITVTQVDMLIPDLHEAALGHSGKAKAFTAAAPTAGVDLGRISHRLDALEQRTFVRLHDALESHLGAAVRAAGVKVIKSATRDPIRSQVASAAPKGTPPEAVFSLPGIVAAVAAQPDAVEAIDRALGGLGDAVERILSDAQDAQLAALSDETGLDREELRNAYEARQHADRRHAVEAAAALLLLARRRTGLDTLDPDDDPTTAVASVPLSMTHAILTSAGGGATTVVRGLPAVDPTRAAAVGLATNDIADEVLTRAVRKASTPVAEVPGGRSETPGKAAPPKGPIVTTVAGVTRTYEWVHGMYRTPKNPLPAHAALHHKTAASPGDFGGLYPGDHDDCTCGIRTSWVLSA